VTLAKYDTNRNAAGKEVENIEVLAHVCDSTLGGRTIDALFADHVVEEYKKKFGGDLRSNPRSMSKLMKTVGKVKQTLSANKVANLNIESLMDGNDFAMIVERELFESTWEHLIPRLTAPI
jgi:molecular chaperone DnaK (HSP70)